jgi:hypothetical protein
MCWSVQRDLLRLRVADLGDGPFERELDVVASVCHWAMCAVCVEQSDDGDDVGPRMERELGDRRSLATDSSAVYLPAQASNVNAGVATAERLRSVAAL